MITLRLSAERGHLNHGWLDTYHTFSFSQYRDPRHMHFRALRVINEDRIAPGQGFGEHPHRDMEILTCILSGELQHRDSMGNGSIIHAGEWQRMSAGSGITHSEFNPSQDQWVHLLQIWLFPDEKNLTPEYEQRDFSQAAANAWTVVASPDGQDGSLRIHQDARLVQAKLTPGSQLTYDLSPKRYGWLQVMRGTLDANGDALSAGDAAAYSEEPQVTLQASTDAEVLLFDLS
jgi:redox-sensitive bicupin YhaK (pirin superfamily)